MNDSIPTNDNDAKPACSISGGDGENDVRKLDSCQTCNPPRSGLWRLIAIGVALAIFIVFSHYPGLFKKKTPADSPRGERKTASKRVTPGTTLRRTVPTSPTDSKRSWKTVPSYLKKSDGVTPAPLKLLGDNPSIKRDDFELVVEFECPPGERTPGEIRVYMGTDPAAGLSFIGLTTGRIYLAARAGNETGAARILADARPDSPVFIPGNRTAVIARRRADTLDIFIDTNTADPTPRKRVLTYTGAVPFNSVSAAQTQNDAIKFQSASLRDFNDISFTDNFMRHADSGGWEPVAGYWVLQSMASPNRSSNPFSLKAAFTPRYTRRSRIGDLFAGRPERARPGVGLSFENLDGYPKIVRITGDGAAARAGLKEDDILLKINGENARGKNGRRLIRLLKFGKEPITITVLRPTEKGARTFHVTPGVFKWGTAAVDFPISPAQYADRAIILAPTHEADEFCFDASLKPLSGTVGLVFGYQTPARYTSLEYRDRLILKRYTPQSPDGQMIWSGTRLPYRPGEYYRLGVEQTANGVTVFLDGLRIAHLPNTHIPPGRFGLIAERAISAAPPNTNAHATPARSNPLSAPAFFDDVSIRSGKYLTQPEPLEPVADLDSDAQAVFKDELDMQRWANRVTGWQANFDTGWVTNSREFPGLQTVRLKRPLGDTIEIELNADRNSPIPPEPDVIIDRVDQTITLSGQDAVTDPALARGNALPVIEIIQLIEQDAGARRMRTEVRLGPRLISARSVPVADHTRLNGTVRIRGIDNWHVPGVVSVSSWRALEYPFNNAPADWALISGRWGTMNKWVCDPRWSWFGGRSDNGVAFTAHKSIFSGDVSIEYFAALMMQSQDAPYETLGDFNCVIMGDGQSPSRGYALVVGGHINRFTALYKNGVEVARTTSPNAMLPNDRLRHWPKPELHQHWFNIKLEKRGSNVIAYFEGKEILRYVDPDPISSGRVGLWTMKNGFLVALARITFDQKTTPPPTPNRVADYADATVTNVTDNDHATTTVRRLDKSATPPVTLLKNESPDAFISSPFGYRVNTPYGGGTFALKFNTPRITPTRVGLLTFDYRFDPNAKVDVYLFNTSSPWHFRIRMTGPAQAAAEYFDLGEIGGVTADGQWHTAVFDINAHYRDFVRRWGIRSNLSWGTCHVVFGNFNNTGYEIAGFNGTNPPGTGYAIANMRFVDHLTTDPDNLSETLVRVDWPMQAGSDGVHARFVFNLPTGRMWTITRPRFTLRDDSAGVSIPLTTDWLAAAQTARVNILDALATLPTEEKSLRLTWDLNTGSPTPPQSVRWPPTDVPDTVPPIIRFADVVRIADNAGESLPEERLPVKIYTAPSPQSPETGRGMDEKSPTDKSGVEMESDTETNGTRDAREAVALPGGSVSLKTRPDAITPNRLRMLERLARKWSIDFRDDSWRDQVAALKGGSHSTNDPHNPEAAAWQGTRIRTVPAAGGVARELLVQNRWDGSRFGIALFPNTAVSLDDYPELQMALTVPHETPINLVMNVSGFEKQCCIYLNDIWDHESYYSVFKRTYLGRFTPFTDDGKRHLYYVPLMKMAAAKQPPGTRTGLIANRIQLADVGWWGNRRGMSWRTDAIRMVPAGRPDELAVCWKAVDISMDVTVSAIIDTSPDTAVSSAAVNALPEKRVAINGERVSDYFKRNGIPLNSSGAYWLHVSAVDAFGNRSRTVHRKFIVDGAPPVITAVRPPPGSGTRTGVITLAVRDDSRLNPDGVRVTYNGIPGRAEVDSASGTIRLYPLQPLKKENTPSGEITVNVTGIRDMRGNVMHEDRTMTFHYENRAATPPPTMTRVPWGVDGFQHPGDISSKIWVQWADANNFERGLGQSHYRLSGTTVTLVNNARDAAGGRGYARHTANTDGGDFGVFLQKDYFLPDKRSILSFDYRVATGVQLDLTFMVNGQTVIIPFLDGVSVINRPPDFVTHIIADGRWHKALIDIDAAAKKYMTDPVPLMVIGWVMLRDTGARFNRKGVTIDIDNFALVRRGAPYVFVPITDTPSDQIAQYRYLIDDKPDASPLTSRENDAPVRTMRLAPFRHVYSPRNPDLSSRDAFPFNPFASRSQWLHIQAQDVHGQWGPVGHFNLLPRSKIP